MRFGISATSLICPKNLRTRLRPVNVCCAIVASRFVALEGEPSGARLASPPGLNPRHVIPKARFRFLISDLMLNPQNAKRRAKQRFCFARLNHPSHGPKKPEICLSPNGLRRNVAVPAVKPCFRAAAPIWDGNHGDSRGVPANLHTILCTTRFELPVMAGLARP